VVLFVLLQQILPKIMDNKTPKEPKTKKKGTLNNEKELAKLYYLSGELQKDIAAKVGVSCQTVNKWVKDGSWDTLRAAKTITRREIVTKMLQQINEKLESGEWTADEMVKATAAIEHLDKQTNVVTIIEVFGAYNKWLLSRMQFDPELTPDLVKIMNKYQDTFISEQLSNTKVQFI